jgi:uncharacterized protein YcbX
MDGEIVALHRYPIKGFTPEPVAEARLTGGAAFPHDRLFAVENGPSGFDPDAPVFIPKRRFAVLARSALVASVHTRFDERRCWLEADAPGQPRFSATLSDEAGRDAFAAWLTPVLAPDEGGPYRLIDGRGHRFLDDPVGHVSVLNLASVRDLADRIGRPLDPLRFRANVHVEGWPAWAENDMGGASLRLGAADVVVSRPIVRCAATEVDPATAERDRPIPADLHRLYGHVWCGIYLQVVSGGQIRIGDRVIED